MLALIVAYPLWGWRRLAAVSGFLEAEASKLAPGTSGPAGAASLGGFDSVAKQVSRLEFLVDEVSERRAFLVRVIEATPDAMCVFGKDGGLLLLNARARALFGAENIGLALNDLIIAVRGRFNDEHNEIELEDGRSFAVTSSVGEDHGDWDGIRIFVFTDITDIRRAEADRRRMLEFLSHDMRSPQVAILGLTSEPADGHEDSDRFDRIRAHARRTMKLADDFVQLARLAEAPLRLADTDLAALADEALDRAWPLARQKRVSLKRHLPDHEIMVSCDPDILSRVLDNLIGNAIKYGDEGGEVSVEVSQDDDGQGKPSALLSVTDNGPGLPPERHADPFKRFGSRGGTDQPGAGLGLAFVQAAIERHEASITWQSAPGAGTRFAIAFSLIPAEPGEAD
jgi:signal transduction histidine kinase